MIQLTIELKPLKILSDLEKEEIRIKLAENEAYWKGIKYGKNLP